MLARLLQAEISADHISFGFVGCCQLPELELHAVKAAIRTKPPRTKSTLDVRLISFTLYLAAIYQFPCQLPGQLPGQSSLTNSLDIRFAILKQIFSN